MKIRLISDSHNEFSLLDIPVMEDDNEQVLILAGDIGLATNDKRQETIVNFIESLSPRFKAIIYVFGNHEYYGSDYNEVQSLVAKETSHISNLYILQDTFVEIDGVIFVGSTLWTSLKDGDPLIMSEAKRCMNDYWLVRDKSGSSDSGRLSPSRTHSEHYDSRDYIFHIASENRDKPVVMVTHHAISYESVAPQYRGSTADMIMNYNFFSDLDEYIERYDNIVLAVHGHTHTSFDYHIGNTRVVCNPRGYETTRSPAENQSFDPKKVIEI